MLTKHQTVLHWYESMNRDWSRPDDHTPTGPQFFATEEVPLHAASVATVIKLDYDVWQDMGGAVDITVTVEPGDMLNRTAPAPLLRPCSLCGADGYTLCRDGRGNPIAAGHEDRGTPREPSV